MDSEQRLYYVINHVFLPPKLPQKDDSSFEDDATLIEECATALRLFQAYFSHQEHWRWAACTRMVSSMVQLREPSGELIPNKVEASLGKLSHRGILAFHIRGQNAGLIIRKLPDMFAFETFELSPTNKSLMTTKGRLQRCFPGPAIGVALDKMAVSSLHEALAQLLTGLDANTPIEAWPIVSKAGSQTIEIRDTVHPKFVTEMLTGILHGIGQPLHVERIYKRTRDDVLWDKALKPWRRSPLWLLIRVALQTSLIHGKDDHNRYKSFMIFFMAHILQRALQSSLPSDILFIMMAKISRRTWKLAIEDEEPWMQHVHGVIEATERELHSRWHAVELNTDPLGLQQAWRASRLSFSRDTQLSISNLRPYLVSISTRAAIPSKTTAFTPNCAPRINQHASKIPYLNTLSDKNSRLSLMDVELWVRDSLRTWLNSRPSSQDSCTDACTLLADLIQGYITTAASMYLEQPEDMSLMLLTAMELWIALDICATKQYPLLKKYEPGFPPSLFNPLLLPKKAQMERLDLIERYVKKRISDSTLPSSLIFKDANEMNSFAVQYFERSPHHQQLRREIEASAALDQAQKKEKLVNMNQEYRRLIGKSNSLGHEEATSWDGHRYVSHHPPSCQKCQLKREADSMEITVYEWPLPYIELEAKSASFELDVPVGISKWRDITYTLLVDVFSPQSPKSSSRHDNLYYLQAFSGLSWYFRSQTTRLQLVSISKPFDVAHYCVKKIAQATEENICVNNGLHYSIYDSSLNEWTPQLLDRCDVWRKCTFQLPSESYKTLQYAMDGTTHTSNEILAKQSECPKELNLHEFYAFGALRSGNRLQWRNIARELTGYILNFNREDTYILVAQAAWQAGCFGARPCRESHVDLEEEEYGVSLLFALEDALGTVEGNWQGAIAVRIFIALATRLLSMSPHRIVQDGCCLYLRRARDIVLRWAQDVRRLLHEVQDAEELKALNLRALELALTCHGTFDVDRDHLSALLRSDEDVAAVTECCIIIHDHCPAETRHLPQPLNMLLRRFERLSHFLEPGLRSLLLRTRDGMNDAVRRAWAGYRPGSPWTALCKPNERWLTTKTTSKEGYASMTIQYNILDGSLLVNGSPLTRLPRSYELHDSYQRLFGEKVLEVVPSSMENMVFETRSEICGHHVHFRMHGSELVIRTRNTQQTCEVIPTHTLQDDFPRAFVQEYTHWLNLSTQRIEWRPLESAWTSSPDNWQMRADDRQTYFLTRVSKKLLDVRSPTAKSISQLLSPLEHASHIHIILDCGTDALEIHLPRMKLNFALRDPQSLLQSKELRGMEVDDRQSFGAFTGLMNKLVLREVKGRARCVIIPHGEVLFSTEGNHVRVMIDTTSPAHIKYHLYHIDDQLGRLVDNGSLQSRLYRLYLHATTSHCMTDQLTGRTGTEEALHGLAGAATRSFVELDPADIELLEKLARLTPRRQFYPEYLQEMQQVDWLPLSALSQHVAFYEQVASILDHAECLHIFQEQPSHLRVIGTCGDRSLLERAAIRESSFQVEGFGADNFTTSHDEKYNARDQEFDGIRELQICNTARLVDNWSTNLTVCPRLLSEIESWAKPICGFESIENDLQLGFDVKWLDAPAKFLPDYWCYLQTLLSHSTVERDKYKIMMFLSTLSYSRHAKQELVQTLLAFATVPDLQLEPPRHSLFQLTDGYRPLQQRLITLVEENAKKFSNCPEYKLPNLPGEKTDPANARRTQLHDSAKVNQIRIFADDLLKQWPTDNVQTPVNANHSTYIIVEQAMGKMRPRFRSWYWNAQFQAYTEQTQAILDSLTPPQHHLQEYSFSPPVYGYIPRRTNVNYANLMSNPAPLLPPADYVDFTERISWENKEGVDHRKLEELLARVSSQASSAHEQQYAKDLHKSFEALRLDSSVELAKSPDLTPSLEAYLEKAIDHVKLIHQMICGQLQTGIHSLHRKARMIPRLSPISLLSHLANHKVASLPNSWKICMVQYGLSISNLQRAERLVIAAGNVGELLNELENPGHQNWDPIHHPEWLLLELENNILIRPEQTQISQEMISPFSRSNSVMQLNMGLGKSSVIVPIVAVDLADGTKLTRVIVLKPLAMQMFQLLVKKLGGMLNRRIFYMPISRSLKLDAHHARQIHKMYQECMRVGGILLIQPEHILSFDLMGLERLLSGDSELGHVMIETQNWLYDNSRDVLDESDEILSVRFELIYTIGLQRAIEFSPKRWEIIELVLTHLDRVAHEVLMRFPEGLEVIPGQSGGVPRIRIIQNDAGDELLRCVVLQFCKLGLPGMPVWNLNDEATSAMLEFLTKMDLSLSVTQQLLEQPAFSSESMRSGLLLLRGLFACGILRFALEQKRWRVNYGLDPSRTLLAVPYHAKDSPAARAEFSHPDATIVLTCLSHYYGGLTDQQIVTSFEALLQSDHSEEEYERWVKDAPRMPAKFSHLIGINLNNTAQCSREVFPFLRFAKALIDFYLSAIVFPTEMKEFPHKLSSSGWDIAREKRHPTTGFSGTNDSRYVLPLSISQCDLQAQLSTNATVLDCLLRPENSFEDIAQHSDTGVLDAGVLLNMALNLKPAVRVILDVGAQVLELKNVEVAQTWLSRVPESEAQAAIFFDARNEICVLSRDGTKEPLLVSPFAKQMDQCLVYLDESHTRGTDLKLPTNYRAIVTLGPRLTKDRLVQACMRMRKLGKGQSVVFCSSMEVQRTILECNSKDGDPIEVADVLNWSIVETCAHTRRTVPLWATQGERHQNRRAAYSTSSVATEGTSTAFVESLLEPEAQSLQERYGGGTGHDGQVFGNLTSHKLGSRETQLNDIRAKCREFNALFNTPALQEEQERELSPEIEREKEVEFPPESTPCNHSVHKDVRALGTHGILNQSSDAFRPAFEALCDTTAVKWYESAAWPQDLLVTTDFSKTVKAGDGQSLDLFLRPVHWIVSCNSESTVKFVIVSPYEAQELLPSIREYKHISLHSYSPRLRMSSRTADLSFCVVPAVPRAGLNPHIVRQLNLFAGQLYIQTHEEYVLLCRFLGLCSHRPDDDIEVASDGFISPASRAKSDSAVVRACSFQASPVPFVGMIISMRRKGQGIAISHMGKILNGELIRREQF